MILIFCLAMFEPRVLVKKERDLIRPSHLGVLKHRSEVRELNLQEKGQEVYINMDTPEYLLASNYESVVEGRSKPRQVSG